MAAQSAPINFNEVLDLTQLGVAPESIRFGMVTLESDQHIVVRDAARGQLVIVDLVSGNNVQRMPVSADAAIMNPVSKVIALRAKNILQISNLEMRSKMKTYTLPDSMEIKYWRWITPKCIALVTQGSVYHWTIDGDSAPEKVFDWHDSMRECQQIINYQASDDGKWLLLVGILRGEGGVEGRMQLYSVEKSVSQAIKGSAGCFMRAGVRPGEEPALLFAFTQRAAPGAPHQMFVMEIGRDKTHPGGVFKLQPQALPFLPEAAADNPIAMLAPPGHDLVYIVTQMGFLFIVDAHTGSIIMRQRIATEAVFVTCVNNATKGILGITTRTGKLLSVSLNESRLVPFIMGTLRNNALALSLSQRLGLSGAEELYSTQFNQLIAAGDVAGAAKMAATAPRGLLRTAETLERFKQLPQQPGQGLPLMQYFNAVMSSGKLNAYESVELAKPVLAQNRMELLVKWVKEDKLECSEELGDMVANYDAKLALSIYLRAQASDKVIAMFMQTGEYNKILAYAKKTGYQADYLSILRGLVRQNPKAAEEFAKQLRNNEPPLIDVAMAANVFMQFNCISEATGFMLDALQGDREEDGALHTRVLEINLMGGTPQVAEAILSSKLVTHYDRLRVAQMCERAQLYHRALENYTDMADIRRVVVQTHAIKPEFLLDFFGRLDEAAALECLAVMLQSNPRGNLQLVVNIASKHADRLGVANLVALFENQVNYQALYFFLGAIVNTSEDPKVHLKYVDAALKVGQFGEVERVCKVSTVFDPAEMKQLLIDAQLKDPRPLIHVCDRFGFVEELTAYLYNNKLQRYIEVYVQKVSPQHTPQVVGKLLDLDADEDFVKALLNSVRGACPVEPLVEQVEQRNRLRMLQPWLEARVTEGNTEPATHNAMGKIYITLNREPQAFLLNNQFYDSKVVGKFCEKLDPYLAYLAYRRAWGQCDDELVAVTNKNGLFKDQARYLVERQDMDLWARVLTDENEFKAQLVEQVVGTALPESKNPDEVSTTVKAFMAAEMPHELIGLLERLVLQGSDFAKNRNLQNLLILTAIKAAPDKVMGFVDRLDGFDGPQIAKIAVSEQYQLFEEAFAIYRKFDLFVEAIEVLIDYVDDLQRAAEFADRVNTPETWAKLARAQLRAGDVPAAIASFLKADDASLFPEVIEAANRADAFADLVRFLRMARGKTKDPKIDSELIYALAKCDMMADLEELVASPNVAQIQSVGDRCFEEGLYLAARVLFNNISNNSKLASCLVRLKLYREAVDAARKANSVRTWKEVSEACVAAAEFKLAQVCGLHIIVSPDHLEELVFYYEKHGHAEELMALLEQGVGLEGAHPGIFTELGVMYSKYRPERLMEHLKVYWKRCHTPKLLRACEEGRHWAEAAYLFAESGDADEAVRVMMEHSPTAFDHDKFLESIKNVRNQELFYRAIQFYVDEQPMRLDRLLKVLTPKLDHTRVVQMMARADNVALVVPYLRSVQKEDLSAVNEALNGLFVDEEKHEDLRESIANHPNFDQLALAQRIEKHYLLEFRRIAAALYKRNKRYRQSIELSKGDRMFKDAIETAAESKDQELAEELVRFFAAESERECFAAALYTCYDLVRPDVVLEVAWRRGWTDFAMPYMIQYMRETHTRVAALEAKLKPKEEAAAAEAQQAVDHAFYPDTAPLAIAATAFNQPMGGMGMGGGMPMGGMGMGGGMPMGGMGMGGMPMGGMGMGGGMPMGGMGMGGMGGMGMM